MKRFEEKLRDLEEYLRQWKYIEGIKKLDGKTQRENKRVNREKFSDEIQTFGPTEGVEAHWIGHSLMDGRFKEDWQFDVVLPQDTTEDELLTFEKQLKENDYTHFSLAKEKKCESSVISKPSPLRTNKDMFLMGLSTQLMEPVTKCVFSSFRSPRITISINSPSLLNLPPNLLWLIDYQIAILLSH